MPTRQPAPLCGPQHQPDRWPPSPSREMSRDVLSPEAPRLLGWRSWRPSISVPFGAMKPDQKRAGPAPGPAKPPAISPRHTLQLSAPLRNRAQPAGGWAWGQRLCCFCPHPPSFHPDPVCCSAGGPQTHQSGSAILSQARLNTQSSDLQIWLSVNSRPPVCRGPSRQAGRSAPRGRSEACRAPDTVPREPAASPSGPRTSWPVSPGCSLRHPTPQSWAPHKASRPLPAGLSAQRVLLASPRTVAARNGHLMSASLRPLYFLNTEGSRGLCSAWMVSSHTKGSGSSSEAARSTQAVGSGGGVERTSQTLK